MMQVNFKTIIAALLAVVFLRLVWMLLMPLSDTTEARYGDMARMMYETGNWVTPWFKADVPFLGKPPLSIWTQTLSIHALGLHEFSIRLPSLFFALAMMVLTYWMAEKLYNTSVAWLSALMFMTASVTYILSGAILMDPAFAFGFTLIIAGFILFNPASWFWKYAAFVGLAIGLLAKGPVIGALLFIPFVLALSLAPLRERMLKLPWLTGTLLTVCLTLPWYILAELRSPGFLEYFIIGEHVLRFIEPGWAGDLYGSAHKRPIGTIWIYAALAFLPWSFLLPLVLFFYWKSGDKRAPDSVGDAQKWLLLAASLSPMIFFTFSRNILWTYILPAVPFLSILLAGTLHQYMKLKHLQAVIIPMSLSIPLIVSGVFYNNTTQPERLTSAYYVLNAWNQTQANAEGAPLYFVGSAPFSANYYSQGRIQEISFGDLLQISQDPNQDDAYFVIQHALLSEMASRIEQVHIVSQSKHFVLFKLRP